MKVLQKLYNLLVIPFLVFCHWFFLLFGEVATRVKADNQLFG